MGNPACALTSLISSSLATAASREIPLERLDDVGQRRAHRKHAAHSERTERVDVTRRDDAADDDAHVVGTLGAEAFEHASRQRYVGAGQDREPDDVHVLLHGFGDDLLWRALEARVHDLEAGVAQRLHHDLGAAIVAIESGLGDQDFHWSGAREAGLDRGWPGLDACGTVMRGRP